ncbi:MAG: hypothetical protein JO013_16935 [Alphaproteobacteria bacterium]|nr:hypothetical protein [Alphaproteobacteria bacterium]
MSREPAYPKDAAVAPPPAAETAGNDDAPARANESRRRKQIMTGAAIGIGSAAIVAALLYANRNRGRS